VCSYGQIIALADLYESADQMMNAEAGELTRIKELLRRSSDYYSGNKLNARLDVGDDEWQEATRERYLDLAEENYEHFSPQLLFKQVSFARRRGDHRSAWEQHHRRALEEAQQLSLDPRSANSTVFPEYPLVINAFGDHFLTDAFAAGHVISKEEVIELFRRNFYTGGELNAAGEAFFAKVASLAFRGNVEKKFSVLETFEPVFLWWNPNIDTVNAFRKVLVGVAEKKPEAVANLAVKALHDRLNRDGIEVFNEAGDGTWTINGDGFLLQNAKTFQVAQRAVAQSAANIEDPAIRASNVDFSEYFARVWKHVPRLTDAGRRRVIDLVNEYTRPDAESLQSAAADLIERKVDFFIARLKKEKKLKDA
jgi:hypothetical protein